MCVGVVLGIVTTLSSKVDGTHLSNGNGLSFEPRGEGKLLYKGIMKVALHKILLDSVFIYNVYFYFLSSQMTSTIWKNVVPLQIGSWM